MTERLTDEEIERGRELEAAATLGPWEADGTELSQHWSRPQPWLDVASNEVACMAYCYGGQGRGIERDEDAELIAWARTHLPALLAEVQAYRSGEPTDEMVERAAKVMFEPPSTTPPSPEYTWAEMVAEDPSRADIWREDARDALRAALGGEQA